MEKKIRVGIFGGFRGDAFYSMIYKEPGFCVRAICDGREEVREKLRHLVGEDTLICETFDEMMEVGIDAVILANYFHEHAKYAIRAMEAGIDVISETTAAPTLGECLDLVECCERTGRKYMLAANCPRMVGPGELQDRYRSGELGEVLYAEAEYLHPPENGQAAEEAAKLFYPTPNHWRRHLPVTYYNMHTLGVLMAATGLDVRRVTAMEIYTKEHADHETYKENKSAGGIALYEMSNGAIFRSTGCCNFGPMGKWFRLSCEKGTIETSRLDQDKVLFRPNGAPSEEYSPANQYTVEEKKEGHGGADARICRQILDYLSGKDAEPIFDIYRAVMLSLAGIYGFYSILEGKTYDIPDIRDRKAREVLRGDYRSPFPDAEGKVTLPSHRAHPGITE